MRLHSWVNRLSSASIQCTASKRAASEPIPASRRKVSPSSLPSRSLRIFPGPISFPIFPPFLPPTAKTLPFLLSVSPFSCLVLRENRGSPLCRVFFAGLFFVPALPSRLRLRSRLFASLPAARPVGSPFPRNPRGSLRRHPAADPAPRGSARRALRGSFLPRGSAGGDGDAENRGNAGSGECRGERGGNAEQFCGEEQRKTAGSA